MIHNYLFISLHFSRSKDETKQKMKEMTSMRLQLDRNLEESNEYRRKLDLNSRDIKRLEDEITALTRDNQVRRLTIIFFDYFSSHFQTLQQDFQHALRDKESLKLQVQEYIRQVSSCENVIAQKVFVNKLNLLSSERFVSGK